MGTRTTQLLPPKQHAPGAHAESHSVPSPRSCRWMQQLGVNTAQLELMQHARWLVGDKVEARKHHQTRHRHLRPHSRREALGA